MQRLLAIGRAVRPTGYARVLHGVLAHLRHELDVLHFGVDHRGAARAHPWRIEPNRVVGDRDGRTQLPKFLADFRPDVVLMCHDPWLWDVHRDTVRAAGVPAVFYCPVEFDHDPRRLLPVADVDVLVAYTEYGRAALERVTGRRDVHVVPHGVDLATFRPLPRASAREAALDPRVGDDFVVLNANRNCTRKRLDRTLAGFAAFLARGVRDAWLVLHSGTRDVGFDTPALADALGIRDRVLWTHDAADHPSVSDAALNRLYNACDVGLNTASGEGWGLVAVEHGATGAPQVVPDHSACRELWLDRGLLLDVGPEGSVGPAAVADALHVLYRDPTLRARLALAAVDLASGLPWERVAATWSALLHRHAGLSRPTGGPSGDPHAGARSTNAATARRGG